MDLSRLAEPFPAEDIEWRVQQADKKGDRVWALVLAYVTNRAIMERLDDVCGPENWKNEFRPGPDGGIVCGLSVRIARDEGAEWVTKWDGAENTNVDPVKGGLSGAMKRAGVQWGIGRYLYQLEEAFAKIHQKGTFRAKLKDGTTFHWDPPALPAWALPPDDHSPDDHSRLLDFIREAGARGTKATQTAIRTRWDGAKRDRREASALADFVEESTGERAPT